MESLITNDAGESVAVTPQQVARFKRLANGLAKLIQEIQENEPEARLYLACDTLHLMGSEPHDNHGVAHPEKSIESVCIPSMSGGDW